MFPICEGDAVNNWSGRRIAPTGPGRVRRHRSKAAWLKGESLASEPNGGADCARCQGNQGYFEPAYSGRRTAAGVACADDRPYATTGLRSVFGDHGFRDEGLQLWTLNVQRRRKLDRLDVGIRNVWELLGQGGRNISSWSPIRKKSAL